jgi:hypothetical protein
MSTPEHRNFLGTSHAGPLCEPDFDFLSQFAPGVPIILYRHA